ncbi:MAG: oxygenase MpaB family protein, partial [Cyclobacteriaceae bacterium]
MVNASTILSVEKLREYRSRGDELLVECLESVDHHAMSELWALQNDRELFAKKFDSSLHILVDKLCILPPAYDETLFKASSVFFTAHKQYLLMMLGLVSLPYCYGGADGSKVLVSSERILSNTTVRLQETGTFVWDVCSEDAFTGNGKGFLSTLKVRLIHQFVRKKLLKEGWESKIDGYPVNQLDQAGTNLSFSLIALRAIRKTGIEISDEEMQSYIHRWNIISTLLGLDPQLTADTVRKASVLSGNIERIQFRKSKDGKALTDA